MDKHSNESSEALLYSSPEDDKQSYDRFTGRYDLGELSRRQEPKRTRLSFWILILLVYIAAAVTVDLVLRLVATPREPTQPEHPEHYTLVQDYLKFEERPEWTMPTAPWNQEPSDELDDAWYDLLTALDIRVTTEEFESMEVNLTNRVQVNGGDWIGSMGVYHHLHCLNNLRILLHWDYYESKFEKTGFSAHGFSKAHSDHCIDTLRQSVMCHPNTGIAAFRWEDGEPPEDRVPQWDAMTTCVNWDSLDGWARQRALRPGHFSYRPRPDSARE